ncbi:MAG TPA: galactokinase family protein, partial [Bacteroidota bacterium]|nr:galactokinase family protein [Bacteroidota bacterium]
MNSRPSRNPVPWRVSTPGRVCLFGEHQDYLDLPVISAAISLRLSIEGRLRPDLHVRVSAPDISKDFGFDLNATSNRIGGTIGLGAIGWRKFLINGVEVLRRRGYTFSRGIDCTIRGEIPIRGGTSSSSAMVVSWINLLARMSDQGKELSPEDCALLAHMAEVDMAGGVGGKMDQYATAVGGVLFQSFHPDTRVEPMPAKLGTFVLGDSQTQKDTQAILAKVKSRVLGIVKTVLERHPEFSLQTVHPSEIDRYMDEHASGDRTFMRATIRNRDITREGYTLLKRPDPAAADLGALLNEQHSILGGTLGISTPKIDAMIAAALRSGAAGSKINGSGGGGCMFAYAPGAPEAASAVAEAIAGQ